MKKVNKNYFINLKSPIKLKNPDTGTELIQIKEFILREFILPEKGNEIMKIMMKSLNSEEFHYFFPSLNYSSEANKSVLNLEKFNKRFLSNKYRHSYLIYANELILNNDDLRREGLVGIVSIDNVKFYNKNCFVSIFIDNKYRHYGIATLAIKFIKNRVFNDGLFDGGSSKIMHKIKTYINTDNINAVKTFKKAGFYKVGIYTDEEFRDNGYCDMVSMECLNGKKSRLRNLINKIKTIF